MKSHAKNKKSSVSKQVRRIPRAVYQRLWKKRRRWQRALLIVLVLMLAGGVYLYQWLFVDLPDIDELEAGQALPSTRIYDRNGRLLYEIVDLYGGSHRVVPLSAMATCLPAATVATEDANFYSHPGVDVEGIARALWINVRGGEVRAGGSTITQQVARNLLLTKQPASDRTVRRKLRESILAIRLTNEYSRDDILTLYLNQTYYGNLAYGVEAASRVYFGKHPSSLSLAECALLAGLPQAPAQYNPLTNPETAKARQEIVLDLMVKHGKITEAEAEQAKREPLSFSASTFDILAPHFVAAVWTQLERDFADELYTGGLEVYTTLDLNWQQASERITQQHLEYLNNPPDGKPSANARNAAVVAMDPQTGEIYTMLGSPDYFDATIDGNVNAALAPRQPGSALKPFTYALAFDPSLATPWTPATMVLDVHTPFVTRRYESYAPANFGLVEHGPVLVREALASSYNIPAVAALDYVGVETLIDLCTRLGITTLGDISRFDLALTLGGGEVRLVELTAAYGAFANGGYSIEPVYIREVRNKDGDVIYQWEAPELTHQEMDPRVVFLINDILADPNARIPSFTTNSPLNVGSEMVAAKTGTTTDFRDNWTIGYTPELVVGVWVGNADNTPMQNVSGISGAGPIFNSFMRQLLDERPGTMPSPSFEVPEGIVAATVCETSGLLPTQHCPYTIQEWFIEGTVPTEYDNFYQEFVIDSRTGLLATEDTPPEYQKAQVYLVLPEEARDWAAREGIPVPPIDAVMVGSADESPVRLLSPDPYTIFQMTPLTPIETQRIRFNVVVPTNTTQVEYWLDETLVDTSQEKPFSIWWELAAGNHTLTAVATLDSGETLTSPEIPFQVHEWVPPDARPATGEIGE